MTTLAAPKSSDAGQLGRDFATEGGVGSEQPERDQAVRLTAAHRLGEVERAVLALAGEPIEAALDQKLQAGGEVVAPEELAPVDLARREILDLRDLLDETVARDHARWGCRAA